MKSQFLAVGSDLGWLWATFEVRFFTFRVKFFFFFFKNPIASALKICIIPYSQKSFLRTFLTPKKWKNSFFRAKNLSVNTWRSRPDICSLICGLSFGPTPKEGPQLTKKFCQISVEILKATVKMITKLCECVLDVLWCQPIKLI